MGRRGEGRGGEGKEGGLRAEGRVPAGKDLACPGCRSPPRGVPTAPTRLWKLPTNRPWPPPLQPSGWPLYQSLVFQEILLQTPELPEESLTQGDINMPLFVREPPLPPAPFSAPVSG